MILNGRNENEGVERGGVRGEGPDPRAHPGAERGPGSGLLLSLVRGVGDVGPEEPVIPLRVGGEPRPDLGLACRQGWAKRLGSSRNMFASRVSMSEGIVSVQVLGLEFLGTALAERVRQDTRALGFNL